MNCQPWKKQVFRVQFVENRYILFSDTKLPDPMKKIIYKLLISVKDKWVKLSNTLVLLKNTLCKQLFFISLPFDEERGTPLMYAIRYFKN